MAAKTLSRLYYYYGDAVEVVRELRSASLASVEIDVIAAARDGRGVRRIADAAENVGVAYHLGEGAKLGTVVGGGVGLLAGLGWLAIAGLQPIIGSGWPIATLLGAATGAVTGAAVGAIIGSTSGRTAFPAISAMHAEGIRRGSTLVVVKVKDRDYGAVEKIMDRHLSPGQSVRMEGSRSAGWAGFEQAPEPRLVTSFGLDAVPQDAPLTAK